MFTGIVEEVGIVKSFNRRISSVNIKIRCSKITGDLRTGDSIAVDGVCLTVTDIKGQGFSADISIETLKRTNLGGLKAGSRVNLERAVMAETRLGGHIVSGHIDGVGTIVRKLKKGATEIIQIRTHREILRYLVPQGSVTIDGISLTILETSNDSFTVAIIPFTAETTTIGSKRMGAKVNIESDIIGKYVISLVERNFYTTKRKAR